MRQEDIEGHRGTIIQQVMSEHHLMMFSKDQKSSRHYFNRLLLLVNNDGQMLNPAKGKTLPKMRPLGRWKRSSVVLNSAEK